MHTVFLLLGSNMGLRSHYLSKARNLISQNIGPVKTCSCIYETEPWGFETPMSFLNQVVGVSTKLNPDELLSVIIDIENALGRQRYNSHYENRTIDIDILFYDNEIINKAALSIPHPEIANRQFALVPMNEIATTFVHPENGFTIAELLNKCKDKSKVWLYKKVADNKSISSNKCV